VLDLNGRQRIGRANNAGGWGLVFVCAEW
jgi:hypothetical protein